MGARNSVSAVVVRRSEATRSVLCTVQKMHGEVSINTQHGDSDVESAAGGDYTRAPPAESGGADGAIIRAHGLKWQFHPARCGRRLAGSDAVWSWCTGRQMGGDT